MNPGDIVGCVVNYAAVSSQVRPSIEQVKIIATRRHDRKTTAYLVMRNNWNFVGYAVKISSMEHLRVFNIQAELCGLVWHDVKNGRLPGLTGWGQHSHYVLSQVRFKANDLPIAKYLKQIGCSAGVATRVANNLLASKQIVFPEEVLKIDPKRLRHISSNFGTDSYEAVLFMIERMTHGERVFPIAEGLMSIGMKKIKAHVLAMDLYNKAKLFEVKDLVECDAWQFFELSKTNLKAWRTLIEFRKQQGGKALC
jgi:hypothetical protein